MTVDFSTSVEAPTGGVAAELGLILPPSEPSGDRIRGLDGGGRCSATSAAADLSVYARWADGRLTVCVANRSATKRDFHLSFRLPPGAYYADRTVFAWPTGRQMGPAQQLESLVLPVTRVCGKPGWLAAGELAAYRFSDGLSESRRAYGVVLQRTRAVRRTHGREYGKLMSPLTECGAQLAVLRRRGSTDALKYVHRALLTVGYALSISDNAAGLRRLPATTAGSISEALSRLDGALNEFSAALTNVVASATVSRPDDGEGGPAVVVVAARNAGATRVPMVRMWVSGPTGSSVTPTDQASFGTLGPGQSARGEFRVAEVTPGTEHEILGHVSYYAFRAPAHLRLPTR